MIFLLWNKKGALLTVSIRQVNQIINMKKYLPPYLMKIGFLFFMLSGMTVVFPLAFPKPIFAYKISSGSLTVYSDVPIPEESGRLFLERVHQKLEDSSLSIDERPLEMYMVNTTWRRKWLWILPSSVVGGFVVVPVTGNHAFFSGADFETNELIAPSNYRPTPPRTLDYYGAHELAHVLMYRQLGVWDFYRAPSWVVEGVPDYIALPKVGTSSLYASIGEREADLEMMQAYGVYAPYRLLVSYFLEDAGWTMQELMSTDLSFEEAQVIVFNAFRND